MRRQRTRRALVMVWLALVVVGLNVLTSIGNIGGGGHHGAGTRAVAAHSDQVSAHEVSPEREGIATSEHAGEMRCCELHGMRTPPDIAVALVFFFHSINFETRPARAPPAREEVLRRNIALDSVVPRAPPATS